MEEQENVVFSSFSINNLEIQPDKLSKLELVYLNDSYPTSSSKELIYKTTNPFYIYLKQTNENNIYRFECYFTMENYNAVLIFIKSLYNKKK